MRNQRHTALLTTDSEKLVYFAETLEQISTTTGTRKTNHTPHEYNQLTEKSLLALLTNKN